MSVRSIATLLTIVCLTHFIGCVSVPTSAPSASAPVAVGTYTLQTSGSFLGKSVKNYPVRNGMTVQNVLEDSGQLSRHRNFDIDVIRKMEESPGFVKMPIQFDPTKHRIKFETDYAIYPGDRVVIRPRSYSAFEQAAEMLGPNE